MSDALGELDRYLAGEGRHERLYEVRPVHIRGELQRHDDRERGGVERQ